MRVSKRHKPSFQLGDFFDAVLLVVSTLPSCLVKWPLASPGQGLLEVLLGRRERGLAVLGEALAEGERGKPKIHLFSLSGGREARHPSLQRLAELLFGLSSCEAAGEGGLVNS